MTGLRIRVTAQWLKLFAVCCGPNTPFSKSITVTSGTTSSETSTASFATSLGVSSKLGSISAKLSEITSQTIKFTKSTTIETDFSVTPATEQTTVVWWQPIYTYHLQGVEIYHPNGNSPKVVPINSTIVHYHEEYVSIQFPKSSTVMTGDIAGFARTVG
jgi:hypothetical protein